MTAWEVTKCMLWAVVAAVIVYVFALVSALVGHMFCGIQF